MKILIVDDNKACCEALSFLLTHLGHEVGMAHDGVEAVATSTRTRPALVILDIGLPGEDGWEVARELRKRTDTACIVALTAYGQPDDLDRSERAGINRHFVKPLAVATLRDFLAGIGHKL